MGIWKKLFSRNDDHNDNGINNEGGNESSTENTEDGDKNEAAQRPGAINHLKKNWRDIFVGPPGGLMTRAGDVYNGYQEKVKRYEEVTDIYEMISKGAYLDREFFIMLIGSAFIASFGLFQNSAAVIIGAMIIAPLMGPILGFALGAIWGDRQLLSQSFLTLFVGTLTGLGISFSLSMLVPGIEINEQIAARIHPNIYDIFIALASGVVGSYAFVNPKLSNTISGVAIAVALVPPLCVIGITLGQMDFQAALGSFLLYLSNLVGISLAASLVFWRMGVHPLESEKEEVSERARKKIGLSVAVLLLIAMPLMYFTVESLRLKGYETSARTIIETRLPEGEILELRVNRFPDGYVVSGKILTPFLDFSAEETSDAESAEPETIKVVPSKVATEQARLKKIKKEIEESIRSKLDEPLQIQMILIPAHM